MGAVRHVQLHYINNFCFIDGDEILSKTKVLKNIPVTIVQGRYDMVCPPKTAHDLKKQLPVFFRIPRNTFHQVTRTLVTRVQTSDMDNTHGQ